MDPLAIEARRKEFTGKVQAQLQAANIGKRDRAPRLFHYTTAEGVRGIITNDNIWATNYRYVNDQTEFLYINELLDNEIARRRAYSRNHSDKVDLAELVILDAISDTSDRLLGGVNIFIACFCEDGDLLSQWRAYGGQGGGFAIGFKDCTADNKMAGRSYELYKVNYDRAQQEAFVKLLLDEFFSAVVDLKPAVAGSQPGRHYHDPVVRLTATPGKGLELVSDLPEPLDRLLVDLVLEFLELACCFKNPKFEIEQEWRIVLKTWNNPKSAIGAIEFRVGGSVIIPYIELPMMMKDHPVTGHLGLSNFMLEQFVFGPGLNPQVTITSLKYLTAEFPYDVEIKQSEIKVRV